MGQLELGSAPRAADYCNLHLGMGGLSLDWQMASFVLRGEPKLLSTIEAAQSAIERGQLDRDTLVTIRLPSGERQTLAAGEVPQFAALFPSEGASDFSAAESPVEAAEAMPDAAMVAAIPPPVPPQDDHNQVEKLDQRKIVVGYEPTVAAFEELAAAPSGLTRYQKLAGCAVLLIVLIAMVKMCNSSQMPNQTDVASAPAVDITAAASDGASPVAVQSESEAAVAPTASPTAEPAAEPAADKCQTVVGFDRLLCQSPALSSLDRAIRSAWKQARSRMAAAGQTVEPLETIQARIRTCRNEVCAAAAYRSEIGELQRLAPIVVESIVTPAAPRCLPKPPVPRGNPGSWITTNDYPSRELRAEVEGITSFSLTVDQTGRVISCVVTGSSGSADLDAATCRNVQRRARFAPATDEQCQPAQGKYSNRVRWIVPDD